MNATLIDFKDFFNERFHIIKRKEKAKLFFCILSLFLLNSIFLSATPSEYQEEEVASFLLSEDLMKEEENLNQPQMQVLISAPENYAKITGPIEIIIQATEERFLDRVEFYVDSILYGVSIDVPYQFTLDTALLTDGPHEFCAQGFDQFENKTEHIIFVEIDNSSCFPAIYVNCGGEEVEYMEKVYMKDQGYTLNSESYSQRLPFANPIYSSAKYGNFSYQFPVPNGYYQIKLKFSELYANKTGKRVFNVAINGANLISKLDLFKMAGFARPYDLNFSIQVAQNKIRIDFMSLIGSAQINGIEINRL